MINYKEFPNPCYIMDESLLRGNLEKIKGVADEAGVEIILAFKSFALWKSFPIFREYIKSSTASSAYEARLAFEKFGSLAHTYSPAYTDDDFDEILRCSGHITFNSLSQYQNFYPKIEAYKEHQISCGIRINPQYSVVETALYDACAPGSRFGVTHNQLPDKLPKGIDGFHSHNLCESTSFDLEKTIISIEDKFAKWLPQIKWINFGGGHLMTRKDYNRNHLIEVLRSFKARHPHLSIIMEPGSAFTWQTGVLTSKVVDIVDNQHVKTALLNVSFTCHMPDCLEMPYQPEIVEATIGNNGQHVYRLGGNSCLSGDFMGDWTFDKELKIGDEVVFKDMIHYTTVKTNMFNGVHHPSIGIWTKEGKPMVYRNFTFEDFLNRMC